MALAQQACGNRTQHGVSGLGGAGSKSSLLMFSQPFPRHRVQRGDGVGNPAGSRPLRYRIGHLLAVLVDCR